MQREVRIGLQCAARTRDSAALSSRGIRQFVEHRVALGRIWGYTMGITMTYSRGIAESLDQLGGWIRWKERYVVSCSTSWGGEGCSCSLH